MLFLREMAPTVFRDNPSGADGIIFDAGRVDGYRSALDTIQNIIGEKKEEPIDIENR